MAKQKAFTGLLNRRQVLKAAALAGLGSGLRAAALAQQCSVPPAPSLTEGPYFVDEILHRSDIRVDPTDNSIQDGFPLTLTLNLSRIDNCVITPLTGVFVDIWHCNAAGVYSDVAANDSVGRKFLRGYQVTDRNGQVEFKTVFPGWYSGRAVHIHSKVRFFSGKEETYKFTSQFFFDDALTDNIFTRAPYSGRGIRDTRNGTDGIFLGASTTGAVLSNSGAQLLLKPSVDESQATASFDLVLDVSAGSTPDAAGGGGGIPPGGGGPPPGRP
jgi:protocatechuate 3,4-dioxygenase beta subunit